MPPIKVLIVDDHTLFRKGLISILQHHPGIDVIGEARDGVEGTRMAGALRPDVILMDVQMPNRNGIEATTLIRENFPEARIIMLTVSEDDRDLFSAVKAGARGYLLKNVEPDHLIKAIHLLAQGEPVIPHPMASKLLTEFGKIARKADAPAGDRLESLTEREKEILKLLSRGESNKEIAHHLYISEHTVKIHLKNILKKLHMNNRIQAAVFAHQQGLSEKSPTPVAH